MLMLAPLNDIWGDEHLEASDVGPLCCWYFRCWS